MKKIITLAMVAIMAALPMMAQRHNYGSTPPSNNRYDYEKPHSRWVRNYYGKDMYFGIRIGPAFSHVGGDAINYAGGAKTGLHLGGVVGFELTNRQPIFFETGISYVSKGGKGTWYDYDVSTDLNYILFPLVFKYIYYTDIGLSIHPLFGGYLSFGVGGNIKNYDLERNESAFGKDITTGAFKLKDDPIDPENPDLPRNKVPELPRSSRFDGGLRIGCGVGFSMFYLDLTYDIGLANISHDDYNSSKNGTFYINFGVNF